MIRPLPTRRAGFAAACLVLTCVSDADAQTSRRPRATLALTQSPEPRARDELGQRDRTDNALAGDARAENARSDKLADNDIATAPIKETKRATHQPAVITGRPLAYVATAGTVTIRDRRLSLLSA